MLASVRILLARAACFAALLCLIAIASNAVAAPLVPGSGVRITRVGDDFEESYWKFTPNNPKASSNIDQNVRWPTGASQNGRVVESTYRGHPDIVTRVPTPSGGLTGSEGALLMRTLRSGVPGKTSGKQEQDDLMIDVAGILGNALGPEHSPSAVVRVFVPPWEQWEPRSGSSLGFRMDCNAYGDKVVDGLLGQRKEYGFHSYWPGFFIELHRREDGYENTHAQLLLRADANGHDLTGPVIDKPGWWTLGMSITPDGQVHYYAREGVGDLTEEDYLVSQFPYDFRCHQLNLIFFNIVNIETGHTWSTPWVVDDPSVFFVPKEWSPDKQRDYDAIVAARRQKKTDLARLQAVAQAERVAWNRTPTAKAAKTALRTEPAVTRAEKAAQEVSRVEPAAFAEAIPKAARSVGLKPIRLRR